MKRRIRKNMPSLSTNQLIEMGNFFHENHIPYPLAEHERKEWAEEIVDGMKPFLVERDFPYHVYVVDAPIFNAFTIPGGNIYVTTALLSAVSNKDELSYIIGHELGHNENDHTKELARLYKYIEEKQESGSIWDLSKALVTQVATSICGKPDELECDIASMYLLYKAGYDPEKALEGIELLREFGEPRPESEWEALLMSFFRTHPWSEDRDKCVTEYVQEAKVQSECEEIFNGVKGTVATKSSPLNMRAYPIVKSKSLAKIPKGAQVEVICDCVTQKYRPNRDWLYVSYENNEEVYSGWVDKKYIDYEKN